MKTIWMAAQLGVVARQAQDVVDAQHGRAQQVRLQSDAVAVAAGQLEDRGKARVLQNLTCGKAAPEIIKTARRSA